MFFFSFQLTLHSFSERSRRNLKSPRTGKVKFNVPSQKKSSPEQSSVTQIWFNDAKSVEIRNHAKTSKFIQGMAEGTLDPDDYGGYMVQDAAYCFSAVTAFDRAAQHMQEKGNPEFSLLYRVQSESFRDYNQEFVKTWRLKNTDSVVMGPAAGMYVGYESALSGEHPKLLCIAMLPCSMLWPWIARELIGSVKKETNPYYGWFEDNLRAADDKSSLEKFVDHFFADEAKYLRIFQEGLVNELNFFRDACDEPLYYCSDFDM